MLARTPGPGEHRCGPTPCPRRLACHPSTRPSSRSARRPSSSPPWPPHPREGSR
ncbi:hypothetical protein UO65_0465 [Actinokineospora spheciospongiae]|uniref:Uncharacterized protein n=1 Tax=Actinokineospora spheciospongiae TaxID=909613 RepID=W7JDQ8_9PSEU|nr:hypothetical protein UO65_0465 [Actinokineospora spheciospongiae]